MSHPHYVKWLGAVLATAAVLSHGNAIAQEGRLSLAERVERMERQLQGQQGGATLEQLTRLNELQSEVRELRGLVEQQQFELQSLRKSAELNARIDRFDGTSSAAAAAGERAPSIDSNPQEPGSSPQQGFEDVPPSGDVFEPVADPARGITRDRRPPSDAIDLTTLPPPSGGVAGAEEKAEYDAARAMLDAGQYASAARAFAEFVRRHPDGELTANALYWLGESYYVTQNFQIALDTFRDLVARFPDSNKVADAMLKIGYCHFELQQFDDAEVALNEVITRYPDTTVARLAQGRLRALQTDRGSR